MTKCKGAKFIRKRKSKKVFLDKVIIFSSNILHISKRTSTFAEHFRKGNSFIKLSSGNLLLKMI